MSGKHPEGHPQRYSLCVQIPRATLSASDPISSVAGPSLGNMRAESAYSLRVHHGGGPTLYSLGFLSLDLVCPLTKPVSFEQQYPEVDVTWFILGVEGRACQGLPWSLHLSILSIPGLCLCGMLCTHPYTGLPSAGFPGVTVSLHVLQRPG